jgi:hypothetical protein
MKLHGHCVEKNNVPEKGSDHVIFRDQLSIDTGAWLEMEHNTSAYINPMNTCKKSLVSLHVTMDDFEHGCDLSRYCKSHPDQCLRQRDQEKELE